MSSWITAAQSGSRLTVFRENLIELDTELEKTRQSARLDYFGSQPKTSFSIISHQNSKAENKDLVSFWG